MCWLGQHLWARGYFVASSENVTDQIIAQYIFVVIPSFLFLGFVILGNIIALIPVFDGRTTLIFLKKHTKVLGIGIPCSFRYFIGFQIIFTQKLRSFINPFVFFKQHADIDKLAKMAGLSRSLLMRYENNRVSQTLETCTAIATILQTDPDLLYDDYLRFIASDYSELIRQARLKAGLSQSALLKLLTLYRKLY